jgi:hypothetical protein
MNEERVELRQTIFDVVDTGRYKTKSSIVADVKKSMDGQTPYSDSYILDEILDCGVIKNPQGIYIVGSHRPLKPYQRTLEMGVAADKEQQKVIMSYLRSLIRQSALRIYPVYKPCFVVINTTHKGGYMLYDYVKSLSLIGIIDVFENPDSVLVLCTDEISARRIYLRLSKLEGEEE